MGLRNKAQHRLDCIVDGRDAYRVERLRFLSLVLCKIRLVSNEAQPLDVFPLQLHESLFSYDQTTRQRECHDRSENPLEARKQWPCYFILLLVHLCIRCLSEASTSTSK